MMLEQDKPVLPPGWDPYVGFVTLVSGIALAGLDHGTWLWKVCRIIVSVGAAYGAASRWTRRR